MLAFWRKLCVRFNVEGGGAGANDNQARLLSLARRNNKGDRLDRLQLIKKRQLSYSPYLIVGDLDDHPWSSAAAKYRKDVLIYAARGILRVRSQQSADPRLGVPRPDDPRL